ncbi:MAG: ROK family transcriptional regulator [Actinobacteria bacterium]|nr:ROK family transcriptional regulator [Actinomycetota bacterium]
MATDRVDSVRRRNLSVILELVHRGQSPSRADLTAFTGLNRSTVGALVAELAALNLVVETEPTATSRAGRPSPRVGPAEGFAVIAINPEVDAITAGVVGLGARVVQRIRRDVSAPPSPDDAAAIIVDLVRQLRDSHPSLRLDAIGLAIPGLVRAADGHVRWAPHLGWREVPFTRIVQDAVGLPTFADNDATVGAHAEWLFGAGRGVAELIYLNGGASGIGGGAVVRGQPLGGAHGYAGEFGQNRPGLDDARDRATPHGTLEDEVSRARLLAVLGLESADEPTLREALLATTDPAAHDEVGRQQRILAVALANAINVFNPELVVLGGFLASVLEWDADALERAIQSSTVPAAWEGVTILPAALGENRLLIGAAELAFAPLLRDPGRILTS